MRSPVVALWLPLVAIVRHLASSSSSTVSSMNMLSHLHQSGVPPLSKAGPILIGLVAEPAEPRYSALVPATPGGDPSPRAYSSSSRNSSSSSCIELAGVDDGATAAADEAKGFRLLRLTRPP
uniref:Putative secreted protein n=1 Tax=Anopheles marajoara TaxID=58244 RepID=A0A2M4C744_9DIPT